MDNKTTAIVSYITIVGWIIAFVTYNGKPEAEKGSLAKYHLKQSFGLFVTAVVYSIAVNILAFIVPFLGMILSLVSLGLFILLILGIINAANEKETPLPIIGQYFEKQFDFIK
jgi:uncharacterized membrane protein